MNQQNKNELLRRLTVGLKRTRLVLIPLYITSLRHFFFVKKTFPRQVLQQQAITSSSVHVESMRVRFKASPAVQLSRVNISSKKVSNSC